ncbi:hypothetical protein [Candidatus Vidania fulgoroideorum]
MKKKKRKIKTIISKGDSMNTYSIKSKKENKNIKKYNKRLRKHTIYN